MSEELRIDEGLVSCEILFEQGEVVLPPQGRHALLNHNDLASESGFARGGGVLRHFAVEFGDSLDAFLRRLDETLLALLRGLNAFSLLADTAVEAPGLLAHLRQAGVGRAVVLDALVRQDHVAHEGDDLHGVAEDADAGKHLRTRHFGRYLSFAVV